MAKMRAVQIAYANGPFELIERDIPEPGPGQVRIKVEACGICHSDSFAREGNFPAYAILSCPATRSPALSMR